MVQQVLVNLAVADAERSKRFFAALGFSFDERFTNERVATVILGENMTAMLFEEGFFRSFLPGRRLVAASEATEVVVGLVVENRQAVDALLANTVAAGGSAYRDTTDERGLYCRAFEDPDGHIWEVQYADLDVVLNDSAPATQVPKEMP